MKFRLSLPLLILAVIAGWYAFRPKAEPRDKGTETEVTNRQLVIDEQGETWERLEFHDGQIRYRPAPK